MVRAGYLFYSLQGGISFSTDLTPYMKNQSISALSVIQTGAVQKDHYQR
jgi:hypothetical protein